MSILVDRIRNVFNRFFQERLHSRDFYLGLALLFFSLLLLLWLIPRDVGGSSAHAVQSLTPRTFPYYISAALGFLSMLLIIYSPKTGAQITRAEDKRLTWAIWLAVAVFFLLYLGIIFLGMAPACFVVLLGLMRLYGFKRRGLGILFAFLFVLALFFFFEKVAQVQIPRGLLFEDLY